MFAARAGPDHRGQLLGSEWLLWADAEISGRNDVSYHLGMILIGISLVAGGATPLK